VTPRRGTFDERVRLTAVVGLTACVVVLAVGLALAFADVPAARGLLAAGIVGVTVLPVVNVVAGLVEEVRKRDWAFAIAAIAVLAVLAYNVLAALG
jgi:hypothetical protein